jgi:hypothetical protein
MSERRLQRDGYGGCSDVSDLHAWLEIQAQSIFHLSFLIFRLLAASINPSFFRLDSELSAGRAAGAQVRFLNGAVFGIEK